MYDAMRKLLALKNPPTAVFVDTDIKAVGAIKAAKDAGLRVPEDISIAGFDDMPEAANLDPSLTSVKVPYYKMGKAAVKIFKESSGKNDKIESVALPSELVIRQSCARAPVKFTGKPGLSNKSETPAITMKRRGASRFVNHR